MAIKNNAKELIGNTPLLKLESLKKEGRADIYVKVEKTMLQVLLKIGLLYIWSKMLKRKDY